MSTVNTNSDSEVRRGYSAAEANDMYDSFWNNPDPTTQIGRLLLGSSRELDQIRNLIFGLPSGSTADAPSKEDMARALLQWHAPDAAATVLADAHPPLPDLHFPIAAPTATRRANLCDRLEQSL